MHPDASQGTQFLNWKNEPQAFTKNTWLFQWFLKYSLFSQFALLLQHQEKIHNHQIYRFYPADQRSFFVEFSIFWFKSLFTSTYKPRIVDTASIFSTISNYKPQLVVPSSWFNSTVRMMFFFSEGGWIHMVDTKNIALDDLWTVFG